MANNDDKNGLVYLLAGFGLGVLLGALAGLLFAPKAGNEIRNELGDKIKDMKSKTEDYINEQRAKRRTLATANTDEVGA